MVLERGGITALLGENGAGKSTFVQILYGAVVPDSGRIFLDGKEVQFSGPASARAAGISMVFQHFALFEAMTGLENLRLGLGREWSEKDVEEAAIGISQRHGFTLPLTRTVAGLSAGERQRLEIVRCLLQKPKILILDEPTSVLTPAEVDSLFSLVRNLATEGTAFLYISHKLDEVKQLCDSAVILRRGKVKAYPNPRTSNPTSLLRLMLGERRSKLRDERVIPRQFAIRPNDAASRAANPPQLEVDNLSLPSKTRHGISLCDVSFSVEPGEIFGIAGIAGNGQSELTDVLIGEQRSSPHGAIRFAGTAIGKLGPSARRKLGIGSVPEDRQGHGAVSYMTLTENAMLTSLHDLRISRLGFLKLRAGRKLAENIIERFSVKTESSQMPAGSLSGGNLQRFVMGRALLNEPVLLVVHQPTWGLDASSVEDVRSSLRQAADNGAAVIIISQDLDEILELSDNAAVLSYGRLSLSIPRGEGMRETLGNLLINGSSNK